MKEYLDDCLEKYFADFLNEKEFRKSDSLISGIGAYYEFKNNDFKFIIANDRGVLEVSLSSIYSTIFFDFELVNAFLHKKIELSISKPKFEINILSKRLDLQTIKNVFEEKYEELRFALNKENYKITENELLRFGNEYANVLFGNKGK